VVRPNLKIYPNGQGKIVCLIVLFSSICIISITVYFLYFSENEIYLTFRTLGLLVLFAVVGSG
jgi:hypothetical protein